jgi:hypothetical protein
VKGDVVEDVALLRAVKRAGGTGGVVDGTHLATTRMYDSWPELVAGYTKSSWTLPLPSLVVLATLYLLPPLAALRGSRAGAAGTPPASSDASSRPGARAGARCPTPSPTRSRWVCCWASRSARGRPGDRDD